MLFLQKERNWKLLGWWCFMPSFLKISQLVHKCKGGHRKCSGHISLPSSLKNYRNRLLPIMSLFVDVCLSFKRLRHQSQFGTNVMRLSATQTLCISVFLIRNNNMTDEETCETGAAFNAGSWNHVIYIKKIRNLRCGNSFMEHKITWRLHEIHICDARLVLPT